MSNHDIFESEFRRRARGMRRTPSARNWSRIERRLDGRGNTRFASIRPWMIAAVVLLIAGMAALGNLPLERSANPLAQRAESMEELNLGHSHSEPTVRRIEGYHPLRESRKDGYLKVRNQPEAPRLIASPKYRI